MGYEYRTTVGTVAGEAPHPKPPDGNGWTLLSTTATSLVNETGSHLWLFWTWQRDLDRAEQLQGSGPGRRARSEADS